MPVISHRIRVQGGILPVPVDGLRGPDLAELDFAVVLQPYEFHRLVDGSQVDGSTLSPAEADQARAALKEVWARMHAQFASLVIRVKSAQPSDSTLPDESFPRLVVDVTPLGDWTWAGAGRFGDFLSSFGVMPDDVANRVSSAQEYRRPASLAAALESRRFVVEGLSSAVKKEAGRTLLQAAIGAAQISRTAYSARESGDAASKAAAAAKYPSPVESIRNAMHTFRDGSSLMRQNSPERYALGFCRRLRIRCDGQPWPKDYWITLGNADFVVGDARLELTPIGNQPTFWVHGVLRPFASEWESRVADPLELLYGEPGPDPRTRLQRGMVNLAPGFLPLELSHGHFSSGGPETSIEPGGVSIVRTNEGNAPSVPDVPSVLELGSPSWRDDAIDHRIVDVAGGWVAAVREGGGAWNELCEATVTRSDSVPPKPLDRKALVPMTRGYQPFHLTAFGFVALSWIAPEVSVISGKARRILHYHYVLSTPSGDFLRSIPISNQAGHEELWPTPPKNARQHEVLTALLAPGTWLYGEISEHNLPLASEGLLGFKGAGDRLRALRRWDAGNLAFAEVEMDLFDVADSWAKLGATELAAAQGSWQLAGEPAPFQPNLAEYTGATLGATVEISVKTPEWPNETIKLAVEPGAQGIVKGSGLLTADQLKGIGRSVSLRLGFDEASGFVSGFSERGATWEGALQQTAAGWEFTATKPIPGTWPVDWAEEALVSEALPERRRFRRASEIAATIVPPGPLPQSAEAEIEAVFSGSAAKRRLRVFRARFFHTYQPGMFVGFDRDAQGEAFARFREIEYGINGEPRLGQKETRIFQDTGARSATLDELELAIPTGQLVRIRHQVDGDRQKLVGLRPANDWMAGVITEIPAVTNDAPMAIVIEGLHSRVIRLTVERGIAASLEVGVQLLFGRYRENYIGHLDMALLQGTFWWRGEQDAGSAVFYTLTGKAIVMALPVRLAAGLQHGCSLVTVTYMVSASFGAVIEDMEPAKSAVLPLGFRVDKGGRDSSKAYFPIDSGFVRPLSGVADREVGLSTALHQAIYDKHAAAGKDAVRLGVRNARWQFRVRSITPVHRGVRKSPDGQPPPKDVWLKCTSAPARAVLIPGSSCHAIACTVQAERHSAAPKYGAASIDAFVAIAEPAKVPVASVEDGKGVFELQVRAWPEILSKLGDSIDKFERRSTPGEIPRSASSGIVATGVLFEWHAGPIWGLGTGKEDKVQYQPLHQLAKEKKIHRAIRSRRTYEFAIRLVDIAGNSTRLTDGSWGTLSYTMQEDVIPPAPPRAFLVGPADPARKDGFFRPGSSADELKEDNELAPGREGVGVTFDGATANAWEICLLPPKAGFRRCEKAGVFDGSPAEDESPAQWKKHFGDLYKELTEMGCFARTAGKRGPADGAPHVFKDNRLHYLADPEASGFEIRFRHVIAGRQEKDWPIIRQSSWEWWSASPNYWDTPQLRKPKLPKLFVQSVSSKPRIIADSFSGWSVRLPPGDRITVELRSIRRRGDTKDQGWSSPYLLYHATERPDEAATRMLIPTATPGGPGKFTGTWDVEINASTTGKIDLEWSQEAWLDDPEQPLPVVPWRYIEHWLDEPTTLDAPGEPKNWDQWKRRMSGQQTAFELQRAGLHPSASAYLIDRYREHTQPEFVAAVPFEQLGDVVATLRDNGLSRNDASRQNRRLLEGSVNLGAETHVRGRFRLSGQTRYERDFMRTQPRVLQEDQADARRLQLNHTVVAKPSVAYVVPLLHQPRAGTAIETETGTIKEWYSQQVLQSGIRLYFQRPWFLSGPGEMIALLFHDGRVAPHEIQHQPRDEIATGTHWAVDPVWSGKTLRTAAKPAVNWQELCPKTIRVRPKGNNVSAGQPGSLVELERLVFGAKPAAVPDGGWELEKLRTLLPAACEGKDEWQGVVQPVRYAVDRGLWYADFWFPAPFVHGMFVRLVLARVQPFAEQACAFRSDPVTLYYCPLAGDRHVIARLRPNGNYVVSYHGVFPPRPDQEKVSLQLRVAISLHCRLHAHDEGDPFGLLPCLLEARVRYPDATDTSLRARWMPPRRPYDTTDQADQPHWLELVWDAAKGEFSRTFELDRSLVNESTDRGVPYARGLTLFVQEMQVNAGAKVDAMATPSIQSAISLRLPISS